MNLNEGDEGFKISQLFLQNVNQQVTLLSMWSKSSAPLLTVFQENGTYLCLARNEDGLSTSKFVLHISSDKEEFPFLSSL